MKPLYIILSFLFFVPCYSQFNYEKTWGTYYLGNSTEIKATTLDNDQNSIGVGFIKPYINDTFPAQYEISSYYDQWTTVGCYQPSLVVNGYNSEGYITKFSPTGQVIWSTYFGSSNTDLVTDVAVDGINNIYIVGLTNSASGIATVGSYISDFSLIEPVNPDPSSNFRGFLAKFSATGELEWSTYLPTDIGNIAPSSPIEIFIKSDNSIFVAGGTTANNTSFIVTPGAFQETFISGSNPNSSIKNGYLLKFDAQGNRLAGTLCGYEFAPFDISADSEGNIVVVGRSFLSDPFYSITTTDSYQPIALGGKEGAILKFTPDLTTKLWGTYYGDTVDDYVGLVTTSGTDIYIYGRSGEVTSGVLATPSAFSDIPSGGYLAKFTGSGSRVWSTYLPFIQYIGANFAYGLLVKNDKLYLAGSTNATSGVSTPGAYQLDYASVGSTSSAPCDGFLMQFSTDGSRNWGSYFGGLNRDVIRSINVVDDNTFYISGTTSSDTTISTPNGIQPAMNYGSAALISDTAVLNTTNMFLAKFSNPLSVPSVSNNLVKLAPNPTDGQFTLSGNWHTAYNNLKIQLYDSLGKEVAHEDIAPFQEELHQGFDFRGLAQGLYFAKLTAGAEVLQTVKLVIK
jgi:hypothetical protein